MANAATGWVEILLQTLRGSQKEGVLGGLGGLYGGGLWVVRTMAGALEIATFWAPVPEGFETAMKLATVFEDR